MRAQSFTEVTGTSIIPMVSSQHDWGDYDNDGDLDLLASGFSTTLGNITRLYENLGNDSFRMDSSFYNTDNLNFMWADFDNDGWLDILRPNGSNDASKLYRNNQGDSFVDMSDFTDKCDYASCVDYNNDGLVDIIAATWDNTIGFKMAVYRNNGSFSFSLQDSIDIRGGGSARTMAWGDYNGDGYPDLFVCGRAAGNRGESFIYKNVNGRDFVKIDIELPGLELNNSRWYDANGDGRLDLFFFGRKIFNSLYAQTYINEGNDSFRLATSFQGLTECMSAVGDYDNDGDPDFITQGSTTSMSGHSGAHTPFTGVYENRFSNFGAFQSKTHSFPYVHNGDIDFADFDNDGDIDFFLTGSTTTYKAPSTSPTAVGKLYKNTVTTSNNAPSAPNGLSIVTSNGATTLKWNAATDDHTTSPSLSYNVILGTATKPTSIYTGNALPNGTRKIPQLGNAELDTTMVINMAHLDFGTTYYAKVQAIDYAYKGSAFSSSIVVPVRIHADLDDTLHMVCGESFKLPLHLANLDTNNISYSWSPSTDLSSNSVSNPICSAKQSRTYSVTCTATNGQKFTGSVYVHVSPFNLSVSNDTSLVCGNLTQLTATSDYIGGDNALTWSWMPTAGLSDASIQNPKITVYKSENYEVSASSGDGCLVTDTVAIVMDPLVVGAPDQVKMCEQDRWVHASHNSISQSVKYSWSPTDSLKNSYQLNSITTAIKDMVYEITVTDSTCIAKDTMMLTVIPPDYSVNFSSSETLLTSPPFATQLTNLTPDMELYNFEWDMNDTGILKNNNEKFFYEYKYNGTYSPILSATSKENGCKDSELKQDYIYCTGGENSSILDFKKEILFTVFPNPTMGTFYIIPKVTLLGKNYTIYSSIGAMVLSGKITSLKTEVKLQDLAKGIYFVRVGESLKQTINVIKK